MFEKFAYASLLWMVAFGTTLGEELPIHQVSRSQKTWYVATASAANDSLHLGVSGGNLLSSIGQVALPIKNCRVVRIVSAFPTGEGVLALLDCCVMGKYPTYVAYLENSRVLSVFKVCDTGAVSGSPSRGGMEALEYHSASNRTIHRFSVVGDAIRRVSTTNAPREVYLVAAPDGFCKTINSSAGGRSRLQMITLGDARVVADIDLGKIVGSGGVVWSKSIGDELFVAVISGNLYRRVYYIAAGSPTSAVELFEGQWSRFDASISSTNTILLAAYGAGGGVVTEFTGDRYKQREVIARLKLKVTPEQERNLEFLEFVNVQLGRKAGRDTLFTQLMPLRY